MSMSDLLPLLPLILVALGGLALILQEVYTPDSTLAFNIHAFSFLGLAACASVIDLTLHPTGIKRVLFNGAITVDSFSQFFVMLLIACAVFTLIAALSYFPREHMQQGEVYAMLMFALTGMMTLAMGTSLITLFVGVEVMSIAIYVLVGARRHSIKGNESTLKYFILGSFASGILLYGIALIYGMVGSIQLDAIRDAVGHLDPARQPLLTIGLGMLLIGMGFKVAAAPFHSWAPDVYEGAPTPITGFMATAVKVASFAFLVRVLGVAFLPVKGMWVEVMIGLSVLTMFTGNFMALAQTNLKRMLAYSSVAHTGYLLMGLVALGNVASGSNAATAILYYLVAYSVTNLGAFAAIAFLNKKNEALTEIEDFAGVSSKFPGIALILAICMASLIGLPPTAGFFGKYYLFSSVIQQGYAWLAVVGIVNSILSVYYYLRVVMVMYMKEPRSDWSGAVGLGPARIAGGLAAVVIVWAGVGSFNLLGLIPGATPLLALAKLSVAALF